MSIVRHADLADLDRLCRSAMHAFADDPVMRWLYPDDDEYYAGDGATLRYMFRRWLAHEAVFVTDDVVSLAAFVPPGRADVPPQPDPPEHPPERIEKFKHLGPLIAENTPTEPHWYLNLLATHPHWQRQGLGARVMAPIMEICDRDGLPMYLETETLANVAYYGHHGFRVRSEWKLPLDGPHMWGMLREPTR